MITAITVEKELVGGEDIMAYSTQPSITQCDGSVEIVWEDKVCRNIVSIPVEDLVHLLSEQTAFTFKILSERLSKVGLSITELAENNVRDE